ncbi:MAG: putative DNA binding domain-containing protein [Lactobacillaceae bacterium]|jgi:ATP-dependent DNA helicase RecG|nr:putative DNA binding domain-containing protein [Lactobacillaceae bacterium]
MYNWPREDAHIEYKKATGGLPNSVWETYSAFLNTDGGIIYLGVDEISSGEYVTVGVPNIEKIREEFVNGARNPKLVSYNSNIGLQVEIIEVDELAIIKITVPKAARHNKPVYTFAGKKSVRQAYYRIGDADQPMSDAEIARMLVDSVTNHDNQVIQYYTFEQDIDLPSFRAFRTMVENQENFTRFKTMTDEEFAYEVGIIDELRDSSGAHRYLTIAGLLLLGKNRRILSRFPDFELDYSKLASTDNVNYKDRVFTTNDGISPENVFQFYSAIFERIKLSLPNEFALDAQTGIRKNTLDDLLAAIRELLANALLHAQYGQGRIIIKQYDQYFEFHNPGQLIVSEEQFELGGYSVPRNQTLVNLFRRAGLVESYGRGGRMVFDISNKLQLRMPRIDSDVNGTTIRLWKVGFSDSINDISSHEKAYLTLLEHGELAISQFEQLDESDIQRKKVLTELINKGLVIKTGERRGTRYELAPGF